MSIYQSSNENIKPGPQIPLDTDEVHLRLFKKLFWDRESPFSSKYKIVKLPISADTIFLFSF